MSLSTNPVYLVAKNELYRAIIHPVNLLLLCIMVIMIYVNMADYTTMPKNTTDPYLGGDAFLLAYKNVFWSTSYLMVIFAGFYGLMSISEERFKNVIDILIMKPLFRRDIILGKIIGLSCLSFMFSSLILSLTFVMLTNFFRPPLQIDDFLIRIITYDCSLTLICSLTIGLAMLISLLFKNILTSASVFITYLFVDWNGHILGSLGSPPVSPYMIYSKIFFPVVTQTGWISLFYDSIPYAQWLSDSLPYIIVVLLLTAFIVLLNCFIFTKIDDLKLG
jgi:ABC-2 type transport system permease protein